jgi:hypothetical protein
MSAPTSQQLEQRFVASVLPVGGVMTELGAALAVTQIPLHPLAHHWEEAVATLDESAINPNIVLTPAEQADQAVMLRCLGAATVDAALASLAEPLPRRIGFSVDRPVITRIGTRDMLAVDLRSRGLTGAAAAREAGVEPDTHTGQVDNARKRLGAGTLGQAVTLSLASGQIKAAQSVCETPLTDQEIIAVTTLALFDGTQAEAAEVIGCARSMVRHHLLTARAKLGTRGLAPIRRLHESGTLFALQSVPVHTTRYAPDLSTRRKMNTYSV